MRVDVAVLEEVFSNVCEVRTTKQKTPAPAQKHRESETRTRLRHIGYVEREKPRKSTRIHAHTMAARDPGRKSALLMFEAAMRQHAR